ncbi:MAG: hypothetical protein IKW90_06900 [Lachnospiraceae bacterium]|nr:hypothetical protein [Lachnospiraceae bacterium]
MKGLLITVIISIILGIVIGKRLSKRGYRSYNFEFPKRHGFSFDTSNDSYQEHWIHGYSKNESPWDDPWGDNYGNPWGNPWE